MKIAQSPADKYLGSRLVQSPHEYLSTLSEEERLSIDFFECAAMHRRWESVHPHRVREAMEGRKPSGIAQAISGAVLQHSSEWVIAAFAGDVEAACSLSHSLDSCERGVVAYAMWKAKVPRDAFREFFASVWLHSHHFVLRAARTRRRLAAMFHYADFPKPGHLPETVRVWRGTSRVTRKKAQSGYSWTTDRDVACWFAGHGGPPERMFVLAADVPKSVIALYHDGRNESEVVLLAPPSAWIDGDAHDWMAAHERYVRQKEEARLAAIPPLPAP